MDAFRITRSLCLTYSYEKDDQFKYSDSENKLERPDSWEEWKGARDSHREINKSGCKETVLSHLFGEKRLIKVLSCAVVNVGEIKSPKNILLQGLGALIWGLAGF